MGVVFFLQGFDFSLNIDIDIKEYFRIIRIEQLQIFFDFCLMIFLLYLVFFLVWGIF